ncbi:hypothetical protein IW492_16960 [Enterococcus sp. BWB1-3]|uniref:hypothetical protein n=1 Tax=Enterococcus sp. BWB1-3 TaxID=2787713 RepID=UPI0019221AAD|nr:hypothetical protein [Enterococcus sp. BWB1-3]MBL1230919.1 hypothetical protein [Enterococcus sp. BWB1-3]
MRRVIEEAQEQISSCDEHSKKRRSKSLHATSNRRSAGANLFMRRVIEEAQEQISSCDE